MTAKEYMKEAKTLLKRIERKRREAEDIRIREHKSMHPDRPSASRRGYTSKWRRLSKQYLRKHPMCVRCMAEGKFVPATVVDHIIPHRSNDTLMWSQDNWQALCKPCHDKKTWTEDKNPVYTY